ncbi:MAG TPA: hypothetical protein VIS76_14665 [Pseudomonadales bacterium]
MIGTDILLTTAELSLALGGFGGVAAALIGRGERWNPMTIVRFRALIMISLGSALLALVPIPMHTSGLEGENLWTAASTVAAVVASVMLLGMLFYARAPMVTQGSRFWSVVAFLFAAGAIGVNVFNALAIGFTRSFTGYLCALILLLILAGLYFFRLIVLSGPESDDTGTSD